MKALPNQTRFTRNARLVMAAVLLLIQGSIGQVIYLFTPLRRRVQENIDRRLFRHQYDAQQVLADFAKQARDQTDLDNLTGELAHVVKKTMQPQKMWIWLREDFR